MVNEHPLPRPILIMFSSSDASRDLEAARELGADGCLVKPLEFEGYVEILRAFVEGG